MSGPKVVIIGAGSFFFGRPVIWNMAHSPVLREGTLALVDRDPAVLATMATLARRVFDHLGVPTRLETSTQRREVLSGADVVVATFSDRNARFRGIDCEVAARYGIRMCSGDTIGPGGIFRALREVPTLLAIARDVEELAPAAWMINFVNPTTVLGMALRRYSQLRSFAICDGPHEPHYTLRMLKWVGVLPDEATAVPAAVTARLDLATAGVNHFSWVLRFTYDGRDMLPALARRFGEFAERERAKAQQATTIDVHQNADAKAAYNNTCGLELFDVFGAFPDCMAHTKEYVPFYQGHGVTPISPAPLAVFDAVDRARRMAERWAETEAYAEGCQEVARFVAEGKSDHATDIIESMWGGLGKVFRINTANRGAVSNLPDDAFLELACHVGLGGVQPLPIGPMPLGLRGLVQRVLDSHELTAIAAATCDRAVLLRAFATDPLVGNLGDARRIIEDLLERERDALPAAWFEAGARAPVGE